MYYITIDQYPTRYKEVAEETEVCHMDGIYYPRSEMIYCKDGGLWVAKVNLQDYLKECEPFMLSEEFEQFKNKLEKQL